MGNAFHFLDIILFAAFAVFIVIKLFRTLGRREGFSKKPRENFMEERRKREEEARHRKARRQGDGDSERDASWDHGENQALDPHSGRQIPADSKDPSNPDNLPVRIAYLEDGKFKERLLKAGTELADGILAIKKADRNYVTRDFLEGAQTAFDMVLTAFAQGDRETLHQLLSQEAFACFDDALTSREEQKQQLMTTLVSLGKAEVEKAECKSSVAYITVRFVSEQINVLYNDAGEVISGDPNKVGIVTDLWTFARNACSDNPNWELVETQNL